MHNEEMRIEMINTVINTKPSILAIVDIDGIISDFFLTGRSQASLSLFIGQSFTKLCSRIFDSTNTKLICQTLDACRLSQQQAIISQIKHFSKRSLVEYFHCTFSPTAEQNIIIYVENITESMLVNEEFEGITEQHEKINQELCIAMTNLDFQLMDLDLAHRKLSALYKITAIVQKTVDEKEVLEEILDGITQELGFVNAAIFLLDSAANILICKAGRGYQADMRIPLGKGITGYAALHRELVHIPDIELEPRYIPGTQNGGSEVAIPLIVNDKVIGVLDVESSKEQALKPYDLDLLRSLASQIAMTISHASHVTQAYKEAATDGLTNLYNYRHFQNIFKQDFKRAVRYERPLSLLLIDIDHFKQYNDINGHLYGDSALKIVASLIRQYCRETDCVFRYGGEEFIVLLPETLVMQAYVIAERIRLAIAEYPFQNVDAQPNGALTVSIGIAGYPDNAKSEYDLIAAADTALYAAKGSTRNRSCIYSPK